jgi:ribosome-associated toxin RatA of RatAB toxin-antitoxin module
MVYQVVGQPDLYPEFMAGMTSAEVSSRRQNTLVYGWEWRTSHMAWRGVSAMALAPPRDIAVRIMHSDLGTGQFRWHFYPADDGTCLAAESVTMDLSTGHRVIRWLASRGSAMSASVTLTLAIVLLEGSRERAVARAGGQAPSAPAGSATTMTPVQIARLAPLLDRGAVVMLENGPDRSFRQAIVIEAVDAPRQRVVDLLHHPERWPEAVPVLSALEVTGRDGSAMDARLVMNLSIFEVEGTVRFTPDENGVELRGTGGGLADLRLRFEASQLPDGRTVIQGTGRAHAARASFFLRQLVRVNPNFERGLNSSAQLLFVRGLAAAVRDASGSR